MYFRLVIVDRCVVVHTCISIPGVIYVLCVLLAVTTARLFNDKRSAMTEWKRAVQ